MKTIQNLSELEKTTIEQFRSRLSREFPFWDFRLTLFGSRARGDAEPDSDMDLLLEIEIDHLSFREKQRVRRVAGEISLEAGIVLSLFCVDRSLRQERGDYSIFENIGEQGIPL